MEEGCRNGKEDGRKAGMQKLKFHAWDVQRKWTCRLPWRRVEDPAPHAILQTQTRGGAQGAELPQPAKQGSPHLCISLSLLLLLLLAYQPRCDADIDVNPGFPRFWTDLPTSPFPSPSPQRLSNLVPLAPQGLA